ncbi:aminotransferase class I/II-fold pyridoxal phosphate-dependent enzyme [Sphaerisporangium fuscum]|uniref:aminotransferase class I/II-fold pyridoxal phosphate-dependent enzyme n=1 Tax=Sphaerisporangium fuscum TaxID=2835868 RepID=UPI003558559C
MLWGTGATGSRLVTGTTELHAALEAELADFTGFEAALVFASGYAANLAAVTALTGPGVLISSDRHNHAPGRPGRGRPGCRSGHDRGRRARIRRAGDRRAWSGGRGRSRRRA